jgi:hypothetical protein
MTVEPLDHQALSSRRALLFCPHARPGWSFRGGWVRVPFAEPRPQPLPLPDYLWVAETEQVACRRMSRGLPISAALLVVLALYSAWAAGDYAPTQISTPAAVLVLAIIYVLPGGALTGMALLLARRNVREAYQLAVRQTRDRVATDPLPDPPPPPRPAPEPVDAAASGVTAASMPNTQQRANAPDAEPPRPYMPGSTPGQQSGPQAPTQHRGRSQPPRTDQRWRSDQKGSLQQPPPAPRDRSARSRYIGRRPTEDRPRRRPSPPSLVGRDKG